MQKKTSETLYYHRFSQLFDYSALFMLPIALFITLFSKDIITLLYTNTYELATSVLMIHIWAAIFVFFNNIQWKWYILKNLQKLALIRISIATIINILLNIYLIPIYGISGAAISTLVSFAFAGYLGNILFGDQTRKIFLLQSRALFLINILRRFK